MSQKRSTRADVARLAGVSTATVSYVMNNGPRPVAAETRARVLEAIEQLDYVPNDFARSLKGRGSLTIGYLVPNIRNPFFTEMTSAFNRALQSFGYQLLLADLDDDPSRESAYLELFRTKGVDGVVAWQTASSNHIIDFLTAKDIPFVFVGTRHSNVSSVVIDEQGAANIAVAHLIELGHRKIAYMGPGGVETYPDSRLPYIRRALADAGLPTGPEMFFATDGKNAWAQATQRLIGAVDRHTAVIAHNDALAIRVVAHVFELGLDVPQDLSLIGYDNIEFGMYNRVPLTSISYSKEALGRIAVELVLTQIERMGGGLQKVVEIPVELIVRGVNGPSAALTGNTRRWEVGAIVGCPRLPISQPSCGLSWPCPRPTGPNSIRPILSNA